MPEETLRSTEVILPLLQLIALTLPVVAILTQVMVRGAILERDGPPTRFTQFAFAAIALTTIYLISAAIELAVELRELMHQSAIDAATRSIIIAFFALSIAILLSLVELGYSGYEGEGETTNTPDQQSRLEEFGGEEE